MLTEEHKKMAYNNLPTPRFDSIVDCAGYAWLRWVYQQYKAGLISEELAKEETARAMKWTADFDRSYAFEMKWINTTAGRVKRHQTATSAYGKERTLENADALWKAVQGIV